jgi:hypothetical protein
VKQKVGVSVIVFKQENDKGDPEVKPLMISINSISKVCNKFGMGNPFLYLEY